MSPTTKLPSGVAANTAAFAIKYNQDGVSQWSVTVDGANTDSAASVATDSNMNVYIAGKYGPGSASFYQNSNVSAAISALPATNGQSAAFGLKVNSNGVPQWAVRVDGTAADEALGCEADTSGNFYMCGSYIQAASVYNSNMSLATTLPSRTTPSTFVTKFNSNGSHIWSTTIPNATATALEVDTSANVYIAGSYTGLSPPSVFDASSNASPYATFPPLPTGPTGSNTAAFVVKYNSNGTPLSAWAIIGSSNIAATSIALDPSGSNVVIGGSYTPSSTTTVYDANGNASTTVALPTAPQVTTQAAFACVYQLQKSPFVLRANLPADSNGFQKYITNGGTENVTINVTSSNNLSVLNSNTLPPDGTMLFNWCAGKWYKF